MRDAGVVMDRSPRLSSADQACWQTWCATARIHGQTVVHRQRVDLARRRIAAALDITRDLSVMWSGGKDSTALAHLVSAETAGTVPLVSEKDDLDYPGEVAYVTALAAAWGASLTILTPALSPAAWVAEHGHELDGGDDMHGRAAALSRACFYAVVDRYNAGRAGVLLGTRAAESHGRRMNRARRGPLYRQRPTVAHPAGLVVGTPLVDWRGVDVYAYLLRHEIPLLPVYQCVAFMHAHEPWRVRKSWWLPGASARHGGVAWLRHYWPDLYTQLCLWIPEVNRYA